MARPSLDPIANRDGHLAVLAMDQRATLRRMLDGAGTPSSDADLSALKIDVVRALAPLSSGVLLDADFGVGLEGMRKRAEALGGSAAFGLAGDGHYWESSVTIPLGGES